MKHVVDIELAYRLHLLGLVPTAFEVLPAYLRTEEKLRAKVPRELVSWSTVDAALAAEVVPEGDRAWFMRRWEAGEATVGRETFAAMDSLLTDDGWRQALPSELRLVVSPALRPSPALAPTTMSVAVGPGTPATLVGLGALAVVQATEATFPDDLEPATRRFAALMAAGTHALAHVTGAALDTLLIDVTRSLLPPQHRAKELERHVWALVRRGLIDQPPGEVDRTIHGLSRRRADRVHRAWQRGFFVARKA